MTLNLHFHKFRCDPHGIDLKNNQPDFGFPSKPSEAELPGLVARKQSEGMGSWLEPALGSFPLESRGART